MANPVEIRVWMLRNGIRQASVAREIGVTLSAVHNFIHGYSRSRRIEAFFRKAGCPAHFLHKGEKHAEING